MVKKIVCWVLLAALSAFVGCATGYHKDDGRWTYVDNIPGLGKIAAYIERADQASFKRLKPPAYASDRHHVYWRAIVIEGADPASFRHIKDFYSRDNRYVYWRSERVEGADPFSFKVVDGMRLLSRDANDYYYSTEAVGIRNIGRFELLNYGWGKDDKYYYAIGGVLDDSLVDCDFASMQVLSENYARDSNRSYYRGKPMAPDVDLETFRVTALGIAEDRNQQYRGGVGEPL